MYNENQSSPTSFLVGGSVVILLLLGIIILSLWGCPKYKVYSSRQAGEATLAQAQYERQVAVAEAKAKMESAALLAEADTIRAHGIAASNKIIGESLNDNPSYLQWLFIDQIKDSKNQIIYVPAGNLGFPLPIQEATRLQKP